MKNARGKKLSNLDQRKLEEDCAQLAAIHQSQPVSQYDMDGTILDVNAKFETLVGFSRAEMIGQHLSMFVDEKTQTNKRVQVGSHEVLGTSPPGRGLRRRREENDQAREGHLGRILLHARNWHRRQALQSRQRAPRCHTADAGQHRLPRPDHSHRQGASGDRVQHGRHDHHGQ